MDYYLNEAPDGYAFSIISNTSNQYSTIIKGQGINISNKIIDKISWKWRCESENCDGNITYKLRYRDNKSILAECDMGTANVSDSYLYRECDFTNFNTGSEPLIFTIELYDTVQNTSNHITILGEGSSVDQNANGDNDFWGLQ
jgi:hypothetical protein